MEDNKLTGKQFFLTRQTANLMEDFVRDIGDNSSLFLVYGDESVGKSWLLHELTSKRFDPDRVCWIDFKVGDLETEPTAARSKTKRSWEASDISELMEAANDGELIVIDHFELASNKARHAIFQSWVTDGLDKKLNLIIVATTESFNDVRQLAQQNQLEVKSFQLLPYSMAEIEAFLGFYLFPTSPLRSLSIPAEVSNQIRKCKGVIGKVVAVAEQQKSLITLKAEPDSRGNATVVLGTVFGLLIVTAVAYWYLKPAAQIDMAGDQQAGVTETAAPDSELIVAIDPGVTGSISSKEPGESRVDSPTNAESDQQQVISTGIEILQPVDEGASEAEGQSTPEIELDQETDSQLTPGEGTETEPELISTGVEQSGPVEADVQAKALEELLVESAGKQSTRFQQELKNSLKWIQQADKDRTTIQIMLLGFGEFTDDTYYQYIESMEKQDIDTSLIKIYPTRINGSVIYGVIYGVYENRREANKQIQQLPGALKANQPISRSIGGIWNEITRQ